MSLDTFNCFKAIELVTHRLISEGGYKISQTFCDPNVVFHWDLISDISEEAHSLELLREVIELWFMIRGFSVANQLFEDYKRVI